MLNCKYYVSLINQYVTELARIVMLAPVNNCSIKFNAIKASIADKSKPPIGGIIPLNAFRYGSVIEPTVVSTGLLQSRFGNQLKSTLIINTRE